MWLSSGPQSARPAAETSQTRAAGSAGPTARPKTGGQVVVRGATLYCARQVERVRVQRDRGYGDVSDFEEIGRSFTAMLALLRTDADTTDDREGVLHRLMEDFLNQLLLLVPDTGALK